MTPFMTKSKLLEEVDEQIKHYRESEIECAKRTEYNQAEWMRAARSVLKDIRVVIMDDEICEEKRGTTDLKQVSIKDLIAELKTRPAVEVKKFLDIREGDTWRISGDVPAVVITVADPWRDRS